VETSKLLLLEMKCVAKGVETIRAEHLIEGSIVV
jgi:hypothetical protein